MDVHHTKTHEQTEADFGSLVDLQISEEDDWEGCADEVCDD